MVHVQYSNNDDTVETNTIFPERWKKKLPDGFTESADSMQNDELKKLIVDSEGYIYTIDRAKDNDTKLSAMREQIKEMTAPYRDAKATQTAKIKYALHVLEGRGIELDAPATT